MTACATPQLFFCCCFTLFDVVTGCLLHRIGISLHTLTSCSHAHLLLTRHPRMTHRRPSARPHAHECLEHRFMQQKKVRLLACTCRGARARVCLVRVFVLPGFSMSEQLAITKRYLPLTSTGPGIHSMLFVCVCVRVCVWTAGG